MGLCTAQVAHGACFDWPRNDGIRQPEVEITIEIVTLGVEPPLEARQSGCSSPAYILVYDKGIRGTSKSSQLAVIAGYVIDHSRDRVFAKVNGRAGFCDTQSHSTNLPQPHSSLAMFHLCGQFQSGADVRSP
jgi:hypothetical protein